MSAHAHHHDHGAHGHSHGHGHGHSHGHDHGPMSYGRAFAIGITLNIVFVAIEAGAGWLADSVALIADAGHNLSDVLGLFMAWGAYVLSKRRPSERYTYGLRSSSIIAALLNAILLLVACGAIMLGAIERLIEPVQPEGGMMMAVAGAGIVVNLGTALLFMKGGHDLNIRGAFLHMMADAAVSAGVVVAGLLVLYTGQSWIDPLVSIIVVGVIVWGTWGLFRASLTLSLQGVPQGIDPVAVGAALKALPGVTAVHHVHIWPTSTTETALTAHLVMPEGADDAFLSKSAAAMRHDFGIGHSTFQIERGECADDPHHEAHCGDQG
ncbi:cation diffusion facilitator family transporter [Sphingomonas crocodyli]|uniref:Cation transporter n=1 Tax=Sphingomonas crocodyli TaxID=1979270 RepID=A0A437MAV9_9SPHN|nr:cation diffusion facilitator family transporter [Sphingomonas crocodyli]RVT94781.1 cation transporter [Sphingomonas crocodyli]